MADGDVCRSAGKSGPKGLPDDRSARLSGQTATATVTDIRKRSSSLNLCPRYESRLARAGFSGDPAERARIKDQIPFATGA
jgi:hypothetical protein